MDLVTGWTGRAACDLQAALRLSNESFAEHLGIGSAHGRLLAPETRPAATAGNAADS